MRQRLRSHLTFANVASAIALFVALATGGAYASHLVVNSSDVVNESLLSEDVKGKNGTATTAAVNGTLTGADISGQPAKRRPPQPFVEGSLTTYDIKNFSLGNGDFLAGSVDSRVALNNSLTGVDIRDQSGVDTCTHGTARFGELCVGVANAQKTWDDALSFCAGLELRIPSLGEALSLAKNYDLPNVDGTESFWAEETYYRPDLARFEAFQVQDSGLYTSNAHAFPRETVCVTTPTN